MRVESLHIILLSFVLSPLAFGQTMVYLQRADNLSFDQKRIADAQIVKGDVVFRHDSALMYCDSAYFYEKTNSLDAFGHVRLVQGDTLKGYADKIFYDGNKKLARMRYHVRMVHGAPNENPTTLTTDSLNYDRAAGVAYYFTGGQVRDSLNTLTSVRGNYRPKTKQAVFSKKVRLVNDRFVLTSDTLLYNTETKIADIVSPTEILYEQETDIHSSLGWYNTQTEHSMLLDRSVVHHENGRIMTGDTIYYDKKLGFGEIMGNMVMQDSAQEVTLYGQYGQMWEENSRGYATDSALMIDWSDMDHLTHIHGDTLFTEELHFIDSTMRDSTFRRVRAHYGVRVYRDDMQMTCDSLVYMGSDSTIHLYIKPICWSENQQISADSMVVYLVNGEVDHAVGNGSALCVMEDTLTYFNQMSGKELTAYLEDGEVKIIDISGNALTIYYPKESNGEFVGLNTTESSFIRMFIEKQKIHHIRFTNETTGILYPMDQIPSGGDKLAIFFWADAIRPTGPEDVFRKVKGEK